MTFGHNGGKCNRGPAQAQRNYNLRRCKGGSLADEAIRAKTTTQMTLRGEALNILQGICAQETQLRDSYTLEDKHFQQVYEAPRAAKHHNSSKPTWPA